MKVFIQIPCLNEEKTLGVVLDTIPREIPGVDSVEILVINDGSTDRTVEVAKEHGVKHFVHHARNPVSYTHLTLPTTARRCRSRWSPYH